MLDRCGTNHENKRSPIRGLRTWRLGLAFFGGVAPAIALWEGLYYDGVDSITAFACPATWALATIAIAYGPVLARWIRRA